MPGESEAVRVVRTLLALHALPPDYKDKRDEFVRLAIEEMIPAAKGIECCMIPTRSREAALLVPAPIYHDVLAGRLIALHGGGGPERI